MALFFHQLIMTSRFNYLAIFHYQDVVCIFNRTQSMVNVQLLLMSFKQSTFEYPVLC